MRDHREPHYINTQIKNINYLQYKTVGGLISSGIYHPPSSQCFLTDTSKLYIFFGLQLTVLI
jgi:hypothetical protein